MHKALRSFSFFFLNDLSDLALSNILISLMEQFIQLNLNCWSMNWILSTMEKKLPTYYLSTDVFLRSPNNWFDANTFIQSIYSSLHIFYIVYISGEFNLLFQLSNYFYKWNIADVQLLYTEQKESINWVRVCLFV